MNEETAKRLMAEGKITNYVVDPKTGEAHVKGPLGTTDAGTNHWPTEAGK